MKFRHFALTATLLLAFAAVSASADDGAAPAAPPVAAQGEKVKLVMSFTKGQSFDLATKMTMAQNMNLGGMEITTDILLNMLQSNMVAKVDDSGTATLNTKVTRVDGTFANTMMGEASFDSDKDDGSDDGSQAGQISKQFTSAVGQEQVVTLTADGTTSKATGGNSDGLASISKLPKEAVGVGDTWTTETDGDFSGVKTKTKIKNTVKAVSADAVTVSHDGTVELGTGTTTGSGNPMAALMAKMKMGSSKLTGETKLSRKDGYVLSSDITSDMEMSLEADPDAMDPMLANGMTMTINQKVHVERKPSAAPTTPTTPVTPKDEVKAPVTPEAPAPGEPK